MKQSFIMKCLMVAAMLSITALNAATAQAVELKGVVGLGFDFGGDTLLSGSYTDGSTWEVKANQGLIFNGGMVIVTGNFETQATVGYKFGGPTAKNGSITFDVVPVELIEFYRTGNVRMGLGLSYHSSPKLKVDVSGSALNGDYKFKDAMGYVAQIGWAPAKASYSVDLRYTTVKFVPGYANPAKSEYSGSVAGLYASFFF